MSLAVPRPPQVCTSPELATNPPVATSPPAPGELSRRGAFAFWGTLAGGATLAGAGVLAYLWPHAPFGAGDAGNAADYAVGTVRYFSGADAKAGVSRRTFYVVRRKDGFVAFEALCAHNVHNVASRCRLAWSERIQPEGTVGRFYCPCHGGEWAQDTGEPITTLPPFPYSHIPHHVPASRLTSLPVRLVRGHVWVDLSPGAEHRRPPHQPPFVARV